MNNIFIDKNSTKYYITSLFPEKLMKIANFREYIDLLRSIYAQDTMNELGTYYRTLLSSGQNLKIKKSELQNQINLLNQAIKKQAEKIKNTENKKLAGLEMAKLKKQKHQLVRLIKEHDGSNHFNSLSEDGKICVCSGFLLQKFLARELIENNPLSFGTNSNGDLIVDTERLRNSNIFQQCNHIRDFVATYITHNPTKVKTPGHFKTMLNNVNNWQGLMDYVDNYFENLDNTDFLEDGPIKASHQGVETILIFPDENLQLVQLHTEKALDYESDKMKHCIGKGSYDNSVKNGTTNIYSIRDYGKDNEWIPHATIEYKDGKIKQIKGIKNGVIEKQFIPATRKAILQIYGVNSLDDIDVKNYPYDLKNIGYIKDINNKYVDIYNITDGAEFDDLDETQIKNMPLSKIKVNLLNIKNITPETISLIEKIKFVKKLLPSEINTENPLELRHKLFKALKINKEDNLYYRFSPKLLENMLYTIAINNKVYDITNLNENITIDSLDIHSPLIPYVNNKFVSVKHFYIDDKLDDNIFNILEKFKNIKYINSKSPNLQIDDIMKARQRISKILNQQDIAKHISFSNQLGYIPQSKYDDTFNTHENILYDVISNNQIVNVDYIKQNEDYFPLVNFENIISDYVYLNNPDNNTMDKINNMAGIHTLQIDASNININILDLSNISLLCKNRPPKAGELHPGIMIQEGYDIPAIMHDSAIKINLLEGSVDTIKFPPQIQKISIAKKNNFSLTFTNDNMPHKQDRNILKNLDFSEYNNLVTLHISQADLSKCNEIKLPNSLKYLAFYDCEFGKKSKIDLSHLTQLSRLGLNKCNMSEVEQIILPKQELKIEQDKTNLKNGIKIKYKKSNAIYLNILNCISR